MSDRLTGLLFLLLAIWFGVTARGFEQGFGDPVGPALFPQLVAIPLGLFALFLLLRPDPEPGWPAGRLLLRQGFMLAALLAYPLFLEPLGFPLATALGLWAMSLLLGARIIIGLLAAISMAIALYLLFDLLLGLHLPLLPAGFT